MKAQAVTPIGLCTIGTVTPVDASSVAPVVQGLIKPTPLHPLLNAACEGWPLRRARLRLETTLAATRAGASWQRPKSQLSSLPCEPGGNGIKRASSKQLRNQENRIATPGRLNEKV